MTNVIIHYLGFCVITGACLVAQNVNDQTATSHGKAESVAVAATGSSPGEYTVYFLHDANGDKSTIVYVGRVKTVNFDSRMDYHESRGRELSFYITNLDYGTCRVLEQGGMVFHHSINRNNPLNNQIRGISPNNRNRYNYLAGVFDLVNTGLYPDNPFLPTAYWENFAENEFLNLGN